MFISQLCPLVSSSVTQPSPPNLPLFVPLHICPWWLYAICGRFSSNRSQTHPFPYTCTSIAAVSPSIIIFRFFLHNLRYFLAIIYSFRLSITHFLHRMEAVRKPKTKERSRPPDPTPAPPLPARGRTALDRALPDVPREEPGAAPPLRELHWFYQIKSFYRLWEV